MPYDVSWPSVFAAEQSRLGHALVGLQPVLEHIGSTAVPGLAAKPIIDIAVRLRGDAQIQQAIAALSSAGYDYLGEYGLPGRHFFRFGHPVRFHVHVVGPDTGYWADWLAFRDALRADHDLCSRYEAEKRDLAARFGDQRERYTAAKTGFVQEALKDARKRRSPPASGDTL